MISLIGISRVDVAIFTSSYSSRSRQSSSTSESPASIRAFTVRQSISSGAVRSLIRRSLPSRKGIRGVIIHFTAAGVRADKISATVGPSAKNRQDAGYPSDRRHPGRTERRAAGGGRSSARPPADHCRRGDRKNGHAGAPRGLADRHRHGSGPNPAVDLHPPRRGRNAPPRRADSRALGTETRSRERRRTRRASHLGRHVSRSGEPAAAAALGLRGSAARVHDPRSGRFRRSAATRDARVAQGLGDRKRGFRSRVRASISTAAASIAASLWRKSSNRRSPGVASMPMRSRRCSTRMWIAKRRWRCSTTTTCCCIGTRFLPSPSRPRRSARGSTRSWSTSTKTQTPCRRRS